MQDVHLIEVKIINSGNEPIKSEDYERPINLSFGENAQILTAEVVETNPDSIQASADIEGTKVKLKPILLNGGDSFALKMLVSRFSGGEKDIKIDGRVAGVKDISMPVEGRFQIIALIGGMLLSLIGLINLVKTPSVAPRPPLSSNEIVYMVIFAIGYFLTILSVVTLKRYKRVRRRLTELLLR